MLAVLVNTAAVIVGSGIGIIFRSKINQKFMTTIISALALVTMVIGISSAIATADITIVIVCVVIGTIIGELLKIDDRIENAGDYIKGKLLKNKPDEGKFTEGFVSACILFCVGSMAIMGSLEAGINGNNSIIFAKSALDFVASTAYGAAMGLGVMFSAVFVLLYQGGLTLLSTALAPVLSQEIVAEMSAVGGVILIGIGINMLGLTDKKIKVANMLPGIFLPIAYFPLVSLISGGLS